MYIVVPCPFIMLTLQQYIQFDFFLKGNKVKFHKTGKSCCADMYDSVVCCRPTNVTYAAFTLMTHHHFFFYVGVKI